MDEIARDPAAAGSGRYSGVAIVLHWLIAALIVVQVTLALRMEGARTPETFAVFQLHKSVGVTILALSLVRLGWRLTHPPPPLPATMAGWERLLARISHAGFYAILVGMPLTGWLTVSASRIRVPTLLYGIVPWPDIPGLGGLAPAAKGAWHELGEVGHEALAYSLFGLLALHVAGALKHQLFSRDEPVLARMAPGAKAGRWFEPRLIAVVVALGGAALFAYTVRPPRPAMAAAPAGVAPATDAAVEAQAAAPPVAAVAPVTGPVRWAVAPGSSLTFATAWSGQPIRGRFDRWTADIVFGPDAMDRSHVTVSVDVGSVNTGDAQRDGTLPSGDWLDAAGHPKAVFTATRFTKAGEGRFVAHGTLSLRGVKKPLDLPFRLTVTGDRAEAKGGASLDRTAFGVGQGEFAATDQIPGKVTLGFDVKARAAR